MLVWTGFIAVVLAAGPLEPAEQAFAARRYEQVLWALEQARSEKLTVAEQVRAAELEAITQAAFDQSTKAIDAFRLALELDPRFQIAPDSSPKIRGLFEEASRRHRLLHPPLEPAPTAARPAFLEPPPVVTPPEPPFYRRWWFWTAAGVVVAGSAATVWYAAQPRFPSGNLGRDALQ